MWVWLVVCLSMLALWWAGNSSRMHPHCLSPEGSWSPIFMSMSNKQFTLANIWILVLTCHHLTPHDLLMSRLIIMHSVTVLRSYQFCCFPVCENSDCCCFLCQWSYQRPFWPPVWLLDGLCWSFPPGSTRAGVPHQASYAWLDPS